MIKQTILGKRGTGFAELRLQCLSGENGVNGVTQIFDGSQVVENGAGDGTRTRDVQLGKLAFYQLNYSRSAIPFKYRRIIGFTATENFASLGIQILPLAFNACLFCIS